MSASSMHSLVQDYVDERRRLGFDLDSHGSQLLAFARFVDRVGHTGPLTAEIILAWAQGEATRATPITWRAAWARRPQPTRVAPSPRIAGSPISSVVRAADSRRTSSPTGRSRTCWPQHGAYRHLRHFARLPTRRSSA